MRALSELVDIVSKTFGPFDSETIGHELPLFSRSQDVSMENSKYQPMIVNRHKWEGTDDTI